ncbi:hypothetical protein AX17_006690 [Amanita inopinata Kibby_2008]|nr:hypothetical protein AX17_006690 [Amanita inopinata Kibby_2008]
MAKRRVDSDSEDDSTPSDSQTPVSKRARRGTNGEQPPSSHKGKGKARKVEMEEDEDDYKSDVDAAANGGDEDPEAEENKFEQEHGDKIRQSLDARRSIHGGLAEHGIIESIEMHQFMCHKYLTFQFGPQINFIIGGKSAVLSAITIALGGKSNSTGRGSGLKSFIREGQSVSEITISIKNQGEEAYKPREYGKSIVITRRFTRDGLSNWKIKSKDGRVVSTKREELAAICDHMNIQVDNPLNILTQDSARQFLSASHPSDKYKFFLKGTQLAQLSEEYDVCLENVSQTSKILARKREALPDLRNAFREASVRYEEAARAREQRKKADDLKKELAWAHVATKEAEMTDKIEDLAKVNRKLPRVEQEIADARLAFDGATDDVARLEQDFRALGDIDDLTTQKENLQKVIRENKTKIRTINSEASQMDQSVSQINHQLEAYERQIAEETRRMEKHTQSKREETQRRLDEARQAVSAAEARISELAAQLRELEQANAALRSSSREDDSKINELRDQVQQRQHIIEQCRQQENDKYVPYGRNIKLLLEKIRSMKWAGEVPLGPLGVHVKAKDPKKWGNVLRLQLGQYLTAFAVTDARDRPVLKKLLNESGNSHALIVIYEKDLFDYSRGEPPENVLTVLRALEISDPYVLRILINMASIERILLAETRRDGDYSLRNLGGGVAWSNDGFLVRVFPEGGVSSTKLELGRSNSMSLLLTGRDTAAELRYHTDELKRIEVEYASVNEGINAKRKEWNDRERAINTTRSQQRDADNAHRQAKHTLNALQQEANDNLPANVAGLDSAKQEAEKEKELVKVQFEEAMRQKAVIDAENREVLTQQNELSRRINEFHEQQRGVRAMVEEAVEKRVIQKNSLQHFERRYQEELENVKKAEQAMELVQQEFEIWTAKALEFCERVPNPRKADEVQRILDSVQKALKEREKRHGATVEEMTIEVNKAKARLEAVESELKQMSVLNRALKRSLTTRLARWQEFRRHIALRCKLVFQYNLSHRGYFGKVLFNHEIQTLQLKVQTDDQIATQGSRDKDPRSLSGGEKSFSTICLLLSLWESIGCPLRCLDEFDVFMDAVNRRISMKMMIETANSSDKKQYILITPQDMTNITPGNTVRVHRMRDPERGQGVLHFGS